MEGAGEVAALGEGVDDLAVGDRVAYAGSLGAYTEERLIPAHRLVRVPDAVSDVAAASMMLQGMTVQYLLKSSYPVTAGDTILVHAAAGGVGLIACQWAKHLGATVIGTVGSDEKAELARAHGCDHPIVYTRENVVERVRALTGGAGVPVVYDSVGKDTRSPDSLDCLRPAGRMVSFGQSSGPIPPFEIGVLGREGLALSPAPHAHVLHRPAPGPARNGGRPVRRGRFGGGQDRYQSDLPALGGRRGAPRARRPAHHRFHRAAAVRRGTRAAETGRKEAVSEAVER